LIVSPVDQPDKCVDASWPPLYLMDYIQLICWLTVLSVTRRRRTWDVL